MKRQILSLAASAALLLTSLACTDSSVRDRDDVDAERVVYAVGMDSDGWPEVWRDATPLLRSSNEDLWGCFYAATVYRGVVIAVGEINGCPLYWDSGDPGYFYKISDKPGMATSVKVFGGSTYVTGWDETGGKVWKDGKVHVSLGIDDSPMSIAVYDGLAYSAGMDGYGDAAVWQGSLEIDWLEDGCFTSVGFTSDGFLVAAGAVQGYPVLVAVGATDSAVGVGKGSVSSMHIDGRDIYLAGMDGTGGGVWKGSTTRFELLRAISFGDNYEPTSIAVSGSDVYTSVYDQARGRDRIYRNREHLRSYGEGDEVWAICLE